jgi:hypothetical protein
MFYIFSIASVTALGLTKDAKRSDMDFISGVARDPNAPPPTAGPPGSQPLEAMARRRRGPNMQDFLCSSLRTAGSPLNLNTGERAWQIAHGETPDNVGIMPR